MTQTMELLSTGQKPQKAYKYTQREMHLPLFCFTYVNELKN